MKQNSCKLKLSAGAASPGTCPGKWRPDLEKCLPLLVGVGSGSRGQTWSFEPCRRSCWCRVLSWAGSCSNSSICSFPPGCCFHPSPVPEWEKHDSFSRLFGRRGKDRAVWETPRSGEKGLVDVVIRNNKRERTPISELLICKLCSCPYHPLWSKRFQPLAAECTNGFSLSSVDLVHSNDCVIVVSWMTYHRACEGMPSNTGVPGRGKSIGVSAMKCDGNNLFRVSRTTWAGEVHKYCWEGGEAPRSFRPLLWVSYLVLVFRCELWDARGGLDVCSAIPLRSTSLLHAQQRPNLMCAKPCTPNWLNCKSKFKKL